MSNLVDKNFFIGFVEESINQAEIRNKELELKHPDGSTDLETLHLQTTYQGVITALGLLKAYLSAGLFDAED